MTSAGLAERRSRVGSTALLVALVYSAAIVIAGFVVPFYSTVSVSSSGAVSRGSATLVAENGLAVVMVLAIPLLLTLAVGTALWQSRRRGAVPIAWTLTGLLALFNLLAMLSIGVFILPVTIALVVACAKSRQRSEPA